jgi:hypothetical protein
VAVALTPMAFCAADAIAESEGMSDGGQSLSRLTWSHWTRSVGYMQESVS